MNRDISVGIDEEPLRIGVRIPPCDRADRVAWTVRRAEELGFDQVWFPDSQLLWRDVFTTLTAAALGTERIGLGTAVTNLATRHPSVVASAARSVAGLAPGRFTLGLGVGNSSVAPVGLRQTGSAELREGLSMLRALLDGRDWDFDGKVRSRLRDPLPSVPLHLAASGPRNLRLAGEIADGVILRRLTAHPRRSHRPGEGRRRSGRPERRRATGDRVRVLRGDRRARRAQRPCQTALTTVPVSSIAVTSSAGAVVSVTRVCRSVEGPT